MYVFSTMATDEIRVKVGGEVLLAHGPKWGVKTGTKCCVAHTDNIAISAGTKPLVIEWARGPSRRARTP